MSKLSEAGFKPTLHEATAEVIRAQGESWDKQKIVEIWRTVADLTSAVQVCLKDSYDYHNRDKSDSENYKKSELHLGSIIAGSTSNVLRVIQDWVQYNSNNKAPNPALVTYLTNLAMRSVGAQVDYMNTRQAYIEEFVNNGSGLLTGKKHIGNQNAQNNLIENPVNKRMMFSGGAVLNFGNNIIYSHNHNNVAAKDLTGLTNSTPNLINKNPSGVPKDFAGILLNKPFQGTFIQCTVDIRGNLVVNRCCKSNELTVSEMGIFSGAFKGTCKADNTLYTIHLKDVQAYSGDNGDPGIPIKVDSIKEEYCEIRKKQPFPGKTFNFRRATLVSYKVESNNLVNNQIEMAQINKELDNL